MSVVFLMLDGLRPDALSAVDAVNLNAFRQKGSHTLQGRSVDPSVTLPCHTSIFHSVPPARHGVMDNVWHNPVRPITGLVEQLHTHEKRTAMFHNWDVLRDVTRPENLYFNFFINTGYDLDGDDPIIAAFMTHYEQIQVDFAFVYFASIDVAGHHFGWMSEGYLKQVLVVDALVGRVLEFLPDDVTIIIHSDHGGHERTHGTTADDDMVIPWMIDGPNIRQGHIITGDVSLLDTAPTIAHVLGVPPASQWEGRAVLEAFTTT